MDPNSSDFKSLSDNAEHISKNLTRTTAKNAKDNRNSFRKNPQTSL
jgi:hypothetical protein